MIFNSFTVTNDYNLARNEQMAVVVAFSCGQKKTLICNCLALAVKFLQKELRILFVFKISCKGLTLPTLLHHASYLLCRQDKKLKSINRKQCWYAIHAVYFFTDREWQEKMGRWRVRVRVVNGKAREIRICFSHNCFNPFSYNKQGNWEET